jgi:uncharacterized LabA/DUF88 family protein
MQQNHLRLAVLIDADNAQAAIADELFPEIAKFGTTTVRRIYGDWTTPNLKGWKDVLHKLAIQPIQQFSYTSGKNSTDSSLIIDAMDLLYSGKLDGFCIISSDSDFTRLATRLRESGMEVFGFGERKTPTAFVAACNKFIYTEILRNNADSIPAYVDGAINESLKMLMIQVIDATQREDGWATLAAIGSMLPKYDPAFDARNFGYSKLGELVKNQSYLETKEQPIGTGSTGFHISVRTKRSK